VSFAGKIWRIVRINEDGTIRIIMTESVEKKNHKFSSDDTSGNYKYYSNSDIAKPTLET